MRRAFYESALAEVAKLHRVSEEDSAEIRRNLPAQFDATLYRWEQSYFFENCLGRHFGLDPAQLEELASLPALAEITERLASFPRVLIHRDFQSQNIILRNGQAHLIDFQGMRPGLAEYDLASLLYDPYVSLAAAERTELLEFYRSAASVERPGICGQVPALRHAAADAGPRRLQLSRSGEKESRVPRAHSGRTRFVRRSRSGTRGHGAFCAVLHDLGH